MSDRLNELARSLAALTDDEYTTVTSRARGGEPATRADEFALFLNSQIKPDHLAHLFDNRKESNTDVD